MQKEYAAGRRQSTCTLYGGQHIRQTEAQRCGSYLSTGVAALRRDDEAWQDQSGSCKEQERQRWTSTALGSPARSSPRSAPMLAAETPGPKPALPPPQRHVIFPRVATQVFAARESARL